MIDNRGVAGDEDGVEAAVFPRVNSTPVLSRPGDLVWGFLPFYGQTLGVVHDSSAATRARPVSARPRAAARLSGSDIPRACAGVSGSDVSWAQTCARSWAQAVRTRSRT